MMDEEGLGRKVRKKSAEEICGRKNTEEGVRKKNAEERVGEIPMRKKSAGERVRKKSVGESYVQKGMDSMGRRMGERTTDGAWGSGHGALGVGCFVIMRCVKSDL